MADQSLLDPVDLNKQIIRATSPSGEYLSLHIQISDAIRSRKVKAKDALRYIQRRIEHENPTVQITALYLTDVCVKNGGNHFLMEINKGELMDRLAWMLEARANVAAYQQVNAKILELIQSWSGISSKILGEHSYICKLYEALKQGGFVFPTIRNGKSLGQCHSCASKLNKLDIKSTSESMGKPCGSCTVDSMELSASEVLPSNMAEMDDAERQFEVDLKRALELSLQEAKLRSTDSGLDGEYTSNRIISTVGNFSPGHTNDQACVLSKHANSTLSTMHEQSREDFLLELDSIHLFISLVHRLKEQASGERLILQDIKLRRLYDEKVSQLQVKLELSMAEIWKKYDIYQQMYRKLTNVINLFDRMKSTMINRHTNEAPMDNAILQRKSATGYVNTKITAFPAHASTTLNDTPTGIEEVGGSTGSSYFWRIGQTDKESFNPINQTTPFVPEGEHAHKPFQVKPLPLPPSTNESHSQIVCPYPLNDEDSDKAGDQGCNTPNNLVSR